MQIDELDFDKGGGLVPAIVQDAETYRVLMLGYMNREAVEKTIEDDRVTFYSRSKKRLWTKGETSGHYLDLVEIQSDCDNDTLLILANPQGPTCHTGEESCFFEQEFKPPEFKHNFLADLENLIRRRKRELPDDSYTTSLFNAGLDKITQKVGEEAIETIIDAKNDDRNKLVNEVSDLVYHLLILLVEKDLSLEDIVNTLEGRHSGD